MTTARDTRRQQRVEEMCAAAIRALSGDPRLGFRGNRLLRNEQTVAPPAAHLSLSDNDDFSSFRAVADGIALRLTASDTDLHASLAPSDDVARLVFDMLEQFRVEALAPAYMPGMARNLRDRHEAWSRSFQASGLTESAHGLLLYTVAQICRSRVTRQAIVPETEDLIEGTRFSLASEIGHEVAALGRFRDDQAGYAMHARMIGERVSQMIDLADDAAAEGSELRAAKSGFFLWTQDSTEATTTDRNDTAARVGAPAVVGQYRVFTSAYDRVRPVTDVVRPELLVEYRQRLDERVQHQGISVPRLARQLLPVLSEPVPEGWDGGQEEGVIDGRRLAQLVASPTERRLFRTERDGPRADALVTFLVDCSGSMRRHQESVAMLVDVLSRAVELAGGRSEVLGFTTGAYNGGRAVRDWQRQGRPAHPGRLNELDHLVFKDADTPWRLSRAGIAGLLKEDLYREGVDGEAVDWACGRMASRPEERRFLVVVSDGGPMDSATSLTNGPDYLDLHLREVVSRHEARGSVRILGLGVGLDLGWYYPAWHSLDLDEGSSNQIFWETVELLASRPRH